MRASAIVPVVMLTLAGFSHVPVARSDCGGPVEIHVYTIVQPSFAVTRDDSGTTGTSRPATWDGCLDGSVEEDDPQLPGDGEEETGLSGGAFPAYQPCLDVQHALGNLAAPAVAHHGAYDGAQYAAYQDATWSAIGIAAFAGTDGQENPLEEICVGDGVIDDVNPVDCGSGAIGYGIGSATGTVRGNAPIPLPLGGEIAPDCSAPADGTVWVVLPTGPVLMLENGPVVLATPIDLCVEQALELTTPAVPWCIDAGSLPDVDVNQVFVSIPLTGVIAQVA